MPKAIIGGFENLENNIETVKHKVLQAPVKAVETTGQAIASLTTDVLKGFVGGFDSLPSDPKRLEALDRKRVVNELNDVRKMLNAVKNPIHQAEEARKQPQRSADDQRENMIKTSKTAPVAPHKYKGRLGGPMRPKAHVNLETVKRTSVETKQTRKIMG